MSRPSMFGRALAVAALLGVFASAPWAQEAPPEDPLDLVALLVRDGAWDKAKAAIDELDAKRSRGLDVARFEALRAAIAQHEERWADAATALRASIDATLATKGNPPPEADPVLYLQLAQALVKDARPTEAVAVLADAPAAVQALAKTWLLRAAAAWAAKDASGAWAALEEGARRFPDDADFVRQQVRLLIELTLYQEASLRGAALLVRADAKVEDVLVIAEALRRGGATERAANVLGQGRLRFPGEARAWVASAALAVDQGRAAEAAGYLQVAAEIDSTYAFEAAELWRRAGDVGQALRLNAEVLDPAKKARQRLGLLVDQEAWDQVVALEPRAERLGLVEESSVAYGLAYARFRTGELDAAEGWLKRVTDPKVFQLATELRGAMAACRDDAGACP